jgi:hypothetical protein
MRLILSPVTWKRQWEVMGSPPWLGRQMASGARCLTNKQIAERLVLFHRTAGAGGWLEYCPVMTTSDAKSELRMTHLFLDGPLCQLCPIFLVLAV